MELRPYQKEAKTAILKDWNDFKKTLLVLPTGCGKTVVFADIAAERSKVGKVLILAHREELLSQAADKLKALTGLDSALEKAESTCIGTDHKIVVGSVQSFNQKRLSKFSQDYFQTIIVDEAHHCLADSYKRVLEHFESAKVLGVTATPDRGDKQQLGEIFENLAYEYSLRDAVAQGYLSPIKVKVAPLKIDLSQVSTAMGDYKVDELGHALEPYLEDIADVIKKECEGKHTVIFLPLVYLAQIMKDFLIQRGIKADEVNGETEDRAERLDAFARGETEVMCNAMLLTEGWDCPTVDVVVCLRPTKVRALYCQMIGRGTRLAPGKDHLLVLDFLWMTGKHKLIKPADIVCKSSEIAEMVSEAIGEEETDLMQAERDAIAERSESLAKALKAAEKNRKQKKLINPLECDYIACDEELTNYVPAFGWEKSEPTEKQLNLIEKMGFDTDTITTKGFASKLIDARWGKASAKQIIALESRGYKNVSKWSRDEASKIIGKLATAGWQTYRMASEYQPGNYIPEHIKREWEDRWT